MPRYKYHCNTCDIDFTATHLWEEPQNECMICGKNEIKKLLTKPLKAMSKKDMPDQTGDLVKKYIDENKEVLDGLRKEAKKDTHE
jgi:putative FmdB family regulatory protein